MKRLRTLLPTVLGSALLTNGATAVGATFTWNGNSTGNWSVTSNWVSGQVPGGLNPVDVLVFGGDITTSQYTATNNVRADFQLNQLTLNGSDANSTTLFHTINGSSLLFGGTNPQIVQNGGASFAINTPIAFQGDQLTFAGSGNAGFSGQVTINAGITGTGNIVKTGTSTFRFGTLPVFPNPTAISQNKWIGTLRIEDGIVRFNNNAQSASTALRANPVHFADSAANAILTAKRDDSDESNDYETSLRFGSLSGSTGMVWAQVEGNNTSNYDIVITALKTADFGGTVWLQGPLGSGNDGGDLVVRGPGHQRFSGQMTIHKDSIVGHGSTMTLEEFAGFGLQAQGAITMAGGTVRLDNTAVNAIEAFTSGRLRNGTADSTTVEAIGGGTLQLIGNPTELTQELTGRLQLGAFSAQSNETRRRSGHLNVQVQHQAGSAASTELRFSSYSRDQRTEAQFTTVDFSAINGAGNAMALGQAGNNPRIFLHIDGTFSVPLNAGGLLTSTGIGSVPSVGWATTGGGSDFATYTANGVAPVAVVNWPAVSSPDANVRITTTSASTANTSPGNDFAVNSLKIQSVNPGTLTINGTGNLATTAILLASAADFAIDATTGAIGGSGTRYFHVKSANLTVNARINGTNQPIVKAGEGTLTLTNTSNVNLTQVVAINGGALRATPGSSLPGGELRLRGGQLEITGGGTFSRTIGFGPNTINWSGVELDFGGNVAVDEDRGSGGFAALGADVNIDLNGVGPQTIGWESTLGFLRSGYALVFGSKSATHRVTWIDNINLSDVLEQNYNAREIRVLNNVASNTDWARISGTISGQLENDLLKTGPGDLELTANNTYTGGTLVHEGRLLVNGNSSSSFIHHVLTGGTLGGKGTVGNVLVDAGGEVAPGEFVGIASVLRTGNLEFTDSTSKLSIDLGGLTAGGNGTTGYDQLNVTGTVSLKNADLVAAFLNGFIPNVGDIFFIILNDGADAVEGQFVDGTQLTMGPHVFNISYTANFDTTQMTGGNDVALQYMIPEPSSALLMGLGALVLARRRRATR